MDFKKLVRAYYETMFKTLEGFINIDSVYDETTVSAKDPYGSGVSNALLYVENLAKNDGFAVKNIDNRVVEIYFGDPDKPNIGVFAHADVVPATGDWDSPPFVATVRGDKLYGRGTSDDKGPAIASYYAIKALFDNKLIADYSVRLVIGGDEERGSSCMHYYFNTYKAPAPLYGFTPDAQFPLIYGEKAITNFVAKKRVALGPIVSIKGGEAANSVIDKIDLSLPFDAGLLTFLKRKHVDYSFGKEDEMMHLTIYGKSAHGSVPELGVNAALLMFIHIGEYYQLDLFTHLGAKFSDPSGKTMDAYLHTPLLLSSTYNLGILNYKDRELSFTVNFRYPENVNLEAHLAQLAKTLQMEISVRSTSRHLLFDPESPFIQTLLAAYGDETGDYASKPLAIGGGTYAKECPNTVAFGSAFADRPGDIHSPNEHVLITDLHAQMAIYARAIYYLGTRLCA